MDPLNEVSTDGGRNMRETCARVLAAALMTGAIAAVVGMSALVGAPSDESRPLAAPPSLPERAVRIDAVPVRPRTHAVRRVEAPLPAATHRAVVTRGLVIVHTSRAKRTRRHLASTKPKPTPAAATPVATPAAVETPTVETPVPAADPESQDVEQHGHAYGHDNEHGRGHGKRED
jgi:hypothetical protein